MRLKSETGEQRQNLSLLDVFKQCRTIRRIEHERPLVVAAVYKFLFAILHRSSGPSPTSSAHTDSILSRLENGLDVGQITEYLQRYHHRFDLFHKDEPFLQVRGIEEKQWLDPWYRLTAEDGSGNTSALFNPQSRLSAAPDVRFIDVAEAVQLLIAHQQYALGGLIKRITTSSQAAISASAACFIVEGESLLETLLLNSFYQRADEFASDEALWELQQISRAEIEAQKVTTPAGVVSMWTWLSRAILLVPEEHDGRVKIRTMYYAPGLPYDSTGMVKDPCCAYRTTKDGVELPLRVQPDRAMWRNCNTFLPNPVEGLTAPAVIESASALSLNSIFVKKTATNKWTIRVLGQANDKSKVDLVIDEAYALGEEMWNTQGVVAKILFNDMEAIGLAVQQGVYAFASTVLSSDSIPADPDRARQFAMSTGAVERFWWEMNDIFRSFMASDGMDEAYKQQQARVLQIARKILRSTVESQGLNRRVLAGIGAAEGTFNRLTKDYRKNPFQQLEESTS